jgi:hypothetical protein
VTSVAGTLGDVVSPAGKPTLTTLGYVLGVRCEHLDPPQRDWWRRFEITSVTNPVVEHETLMSFLATASPRGLTCAAGSPVRISSPWRHNKSKVTSIISLTYPCEKPRGGHTVEPVERRSASDAGGGRPLPNRLLAVPPCTAGDGFSDQPRRASHPGPSGARRRGRNRSQEPARCRQGGRHPEGPGPGQATPPLVGPSLRRGPPGVRDLPHGRRGRGHRDGRSIINGKASMTYTCYTDGGAEGGDGRSSRCSCRPRSRCPPRRFFLPA